MSDDPSTIRSAGRSASEVVGAGSGTIKRLRKLAGRPRDRRADGHYVVEGPVLVAEALDGDRRVDTLIVGTEASAADGVAALVERATARGVRVVVAPDDAVAKALDSVTSRPVAAVVARPDPGPADLPAAGPLLVLVDVGDPGNVGTLLRTAEAAGFAGVILAGSSADPSSPKAVRSAAGAYGRLPVVEIADAGGLRAAVGERALVATVVGGAPDYDTTDLRHVALLIGSEAHGLAPELVAACDRAVTIPLAGPTESLNAAAAGAVLAFESLRQRRGDEPPGP